MVIGAVVIVILLSKPLEEHDDVDDVTGSLDEGIREDIIIAHSSLRVFVFVHESNNVLKHFITILLK